MDPEKVKKHMIEVLDEEIGILTALKSVALDMERERSEYRVEQVLLSHQAALDLYMRFDIYLSRETDRLLDRLERLQRLRRSHRHRPS